MNSKGINAINKVIDGNIGFQHNPRRIPEKMDKIYTRELLKLSFLFVY
jgi:hypothetical protein